jgi:hypothetical protein
MNTVNEILVSAHSLGHACFDNAFEILSLQISRLFWTSHYEKVCPRPAVAGCAARLTELYDSKCDASDGRLRPSTPSCLTLPDSISCGRATRPFYL